MKLINARKIFLTIAACALLTLPVFAALDSDAADSDTTASTASETASDQEAADTANSGAEAPAADAAGDAAGNVNNDQTNAGTSDITPISGEANPDTGTDSIALPFMLSLLSAGAVAVAVINQKNKK